MPEVLDWHRSHDPRDAAERVVRSLTEGQIVALPTDTEYVLAASALVPAAVERITTALSFSTRPSLVVRDAAELVDFVPDLSQVGRRLVRRSWPGPVEIVCSSNGEGLVSRLDASVQRCLAGGAPLSYRSPGHEAFQRVQRLLAGPLVLRPAADDLPWLTADQVATAGPGLIDLVVDAGPMPRSGPPTVVELNGASWAVLREGVVSREELDRRSAAMVIFVCTGNTCRSPLAEAFCKRQLADRLGCTPVDLPQRGFIVLSAGLAAMDGAPAAQEAVAIAQEHGTDLAAHASRALTAEVAVQADYLVVMTRGHHLALAGQLPPRGPRARLLAPEGQDVPDPIGHDQETYRDCARQIWSHVEHLVAELVPPS